MLRCTNWRSGLAASMAGALCFVIAGTANVSYGAPVSLPFTEDFSTTAPDFTFFAQSGSGTAAWDVNPASSGVGRLTLTDRQRTRTHGATVETPSELQSLDFVVSTTIAINSYSHNATGGASGFNAGLALFASSTDFSLTPYLADFDPQAQTVRLLGGSLETQETLSGAFTFSEGEIYTLTVEGTYSLAGLTLTFTFEDPSETIPIVLKATDATPLTGAYFGYRWRTGGGDPTSAVYNAQLDVDKFSITIVPEPSASILMIVGGFVSLAVARKRKAAK